MASVQKPQEVRDLLGKVKNILKTRKRLYSHIGHAVSSLSAVEHALHALFFICSDKLTDVQTTKFFSEIGWIKSRIILVDYAVQMKAVESELTDWKEIKKILIENKSIRDFASHYHVDLRFDNKQKETLALLRRPEYSNSRSKSNEFITEEQLENAGRELDDVQRRIVDLIEKMGERLYG